MVAPVKGGVLQGRILTNKDRIERQEGKVEILQKEFERCGAFTYSDEFLDEMEKLAKLKRGEKC